MYQIVTTFVKFYATLVEIWRKLTKTWLFSKLLHLCASYTYNNIFVPVVSRMSIGVHYPHENGRNSYNLLFRQIWPSNLIVIWTIVSISTAHYQYIWYIHIELARWCARKLQNDLFVIFRAWQMVWWATPTKNQNQQKHLAGR